MSLPANLFSTAFRQQRLGAILSFLIGIMVYLGSMAMAAQAVLARTSYVWGHDLQNRLTIEIPARADETAEQRESRAQKALEALAQRKEIAEAALVPESETIRLLKPWIADPALLESLALPRLLDVEVTREQNPDFDRLKQLLKPVVGEVRLHRYEQGMAQLLGFLKGLGVLAGFMLVLTAISIVAIIGVICRAAMAAQRETIELLHFMGATDAVVARQFQAHVRKLAVPASLTGFVLAALTVGALGTMLVSLGGLSLISPLSWVTVVGVMLCVPLAAAGLAVVTARLSVQGLLRRLA